MPLLRAHNIQRSINFEKLVHVPTRLVSDQQLLRKHDLLICMSSGSHSLVGKAAPVLSDEQATFGAFCSVFRPCSEAIAPYLARFFESPLYRDGIAGDSRGIGINNLRAGDIESLMIPLPPLAEQRRIVAKVDELMGLLDELERARDERDARRAAFRDSALAALQNAEDAKAAHAAWTRIATNLADCLTDPADIAPLRQTILQLAVRGRLVPQDPGDEPAYRILERLTRSSAVDSRSPKGTIELPRDLAPLPAGWAYAPLADIVSVLNGRAYKKPELLDSGTPVLRVGNLFTSNDWYYSNLELEPEKYCSAGDLLFAWSASFGPFIWAGPKVIYHYHIWKLEPHIDDQVNRHYLRLFLQNQTERIKASGHGLAMIHMTKAKMERLPIPVPPLAEQRRIVAKVDELMAVCDELEQQLIDAKAHQSAFAAAAVHHLEV
ncbi:restriction endonuclease subunit S [Nodularia spumigena]|uniref:restriction endonuclease subunit S n=1 Tax=Nodularia spumigena TaxID=70799 RepID=UPI002B1F3B3F|nr:restriction endonuclease subunit S [Nodularia spumigena]MEA5615128.1 restriction endonuclease subunit S [Nodularia spumigena UHCC 0040]